MATHDYIVTKSNRLVEAGYMLTLQEFKLISACVAKFDSRKPIPDSSTISASEFSDLMGIPMNESYKELKVAVNALYNRSIILRDDSEVHLEARWLDQKAIYKRGEGKVTIFWSNIIKQHLGELKSRFTEVKMRHIGVMGSAYSVRLFEMLMQFQETGIRHVSMEEFRFMLCIEDKYLDFRDLYKRIIKPALEEINAKTNFKVICERVSHGRKIVALQFNFYEEKQGKLDFV